jgi:alpha-1,2-mannosyltransferase
MAISDPHSHRARSVAARLGIILTICALVAMAVMIVIDPTKRSVIPVYISAAASFFARSNFYTPEASGGFLYLPVFAALFYPMTIFGPLLANLIWRTLILLVLSFALLRAARRVNAGRDRFDIMGLTLLFAIFGAAGAVRNGQSTPLLLAATFLAFDAAYDRRFARAAGWATLAVIAKPLGIVVWLLIGATRPNSLPWLLSFLTITLLAPFACADANYVYFLYTQFIAMMSNISPELGGGAPWTDFMAIVRALGLSLDVPIIRAIQLVAALMTFIAALNLMRKRDYLTASVAPATLACSYMLLFNPRAEINTYIMMAVPYSLLAAHLLCATQKIYSGLAIAAACVALGTGALGYQVMKIFDPWSKPVLLLICIGVCYFSLWRKTDHGAEPG